MHKYWGKTFNEISKFIEQQIRAGRSRNGLLADLESL